VRAAKHSSSLVFQLLFSRANTCREFLGRKLEIRYDKGHLAPGSGEKKKQQHEKKDHHQQQQDPKESLKMKVDGALSARR